VKLYTITITARIDDLDALDISLSADVEIADPSLQRVAMTAMPAHLRKVANDIAEEAS
jgi:hypothetical protein